MTRRTVTVTVTAEHIAKGRWGDSDACPLALALHEHGYRKASVGVYTFQPYGTASWVRLTAKAIRFVSAFDTRRPVAPATFRLPLSPTTTHP